MRQRHDEGCLALNGRRYHCWHEIERRTITMGPIHMDTSSRCCFCAALKTEHYEQKPDPEHGPYQPPQLVRVSTNYFEGLPVAWPDQPDLPAADQVPGNQPSGEDASHRDDGRGCGDDEL